MQTSRQGRLEIAHHEGCCLRPYFDNVHVITVGIGATVTEFPDLATWDKSKYFTLQQCCDMFKEHLVRYENAVNNHLIVDVTQPQFDALVSLCYNIGTGGFANSSLLRSINAKHSMDDIAVCFMMWNKPRGIIGRRADEKDLYKTGKYSNNGTILVTDTDGNGHELEHSAKSVDVRDII